MSKLVSVIVPVYNMERYVANCIESILVQTYENFELILVDDGSTDQSGNICDFFAKSDSRIKVIHQDNGGLVAARQTGLKNSAGALIMPVDSDDWIDETMLEAMVGYHERYHADIVLSGVIYECEDGKSIVCEEKEFEGFYDLREKGSSVYKDMFVKEYGSISRSIRSNLWSRLYTRDNIYNNQMEVDVRIRNGEDDACFFPCFLDAKAVYFTHEVFYHCRARSNSMSHDASLRNLQEVDLLEERLRKKIKGHPYEQILNKELDKYIYLRISDILNIKYGYSLNPAYVFPYYSVPCNSKIIIYGAGVVGKSYVKQVVNSELYELVGLIDKRATEEEGLVKVEKIDTLREKEFDYIILATTKAEYAEEMKAEVRCVLGDDRQVIWVKPVLTKKLLQIEWK